MVKDRLVSVRKRIEEAARRVGRNPEDIGLVVVTKEAALEQIREAIGSGVTNIGENRVKDALLKQKKLDAPSIRWHMIGHLQTNKVKDAVKHFSVIHSLDSVKLAYIINKEAERNNKIQDVFIEVNISGEESKFGIKPNVLGEFLEEIRSLKNINTLGLMTMAPFSDNPETARPYFKKLKELAKQYNLKELSMGMTQDFEVAVEEGATVVRVGSAIFSV